MEQGGVYRSTEGDLHIRALQRSWFPQNQIAVSKYLFPLKGPPGPLREMADSRTQVDKVPDEPGTSHGTRK